MGILLPMANAGAQRQGIKNIIFMVPDGLGISNVTAARTYAFGTGPRRLRFEKLEHIGYQSTHSKNSMVTDSAAASSAWACGEKFENGEIAFHSDSQTSPRTILEIARLHGKSTGLVATSTITHATPAAFAAHTHDRQCEQEIARQMVSTPGVDVILGAGRGVFKTGSQDPDPCGTWGDFIHLARKNGYRVVFKRSEMMAGSAEERLLGLFRHVSLTPAYRRDRLKNTQEEPTLAEMTQKALDILERNPKGFFLLVEGSQIDWANHANNLEYQVQEILEFDSAVGVVLDWIRASGHRSQETLLIVVPDHDCGGFSIQGPRNRNPKSPGTLVDGRWISGGHTGEDTLIWSQGPYSEYLGRAIDNTDLFFIMKAALLHETYHPR